VAATPGVGPAPRPGGAPDAGHGGLQLGLRRFLPAPQAAENIQLPTRAQVGFVKLAVAVEIGRGVEQAAQWRFQRLMRARRLRADIARRQQSGGGVFQRGAGDGHPRRGLRQIEVVCQRLGYQLAQQGVAKTLPPGGKIRRLHGRALRDGVLAHETIGRV
jgi:hypothetical protein